ncbi:uncharacterized protein N7459_001892 [Penicillium hispanicum]|uniref:uncharacterized protein n=1 Tax=Penicillium hispanicum TaxID=1080232 RepID=UPI0025415348|nr:uncharacterized protein N7459_001892 [Penicillium hispanicum]KAJ5591523.1 hypothetical protein N7459_001892 [Penicillium hispanicum]
MAPRSNKRRRDEDNDEEAESVAVFVPSAHDLDEVPELRRRRVLKRPYLRGDLAPIHSLEEIFHDLAAKALRLGFGKVLQRLAGRPLRVATVCSGTESPLLALEMIQKALGTGQEFRVSHVFSCEIVPFKQAYIERNFGPPLLFRDLLELNGDTARTAYGSPELIPGDLDILIAGTACVDFSTLNNKQKTMEDIGESGATFKALLQYAARRRPPIVILENVRGAPWEEACQYWDSIGYLALHVIVDTKEYYIPQTRVRGYLLAMDNSHGGIGNSDWADISGRFLELVSEFKRPASSPAGMFLLSDDDRRLEQIRKDLSTRLEASTARAEVAWERYQERHASHRTETRVGEQRPISRSQGGGVTCQPPVFYWNQWFRAQVERIWETLDIKFLLGLQKEVDMNYKERWFDLSQGVDRGGDGTTSFGVAGCLTPSGMPFISTRGGPLSGLEALSLQGLPINRMILTRESQRDLQDLAGNAMTSTVVCAVMLAALSAGYMALEPGPKQGESRKQIEEQSSVEKKLMPTFEDCTDLRRTDIEAGHGFSSEAREDKARAEGYARYAAIILKAARTVRMCLCEKQSGVEEDLVECVLCQHTSCRSCAGNPPHPSQPLTIPRSSPLNFIAYLKGILPMRLVLSGLSSTDFNGFKSRFPEDGTWQTFTDTVHSALDDEMRFVDIKRTEFWTVIYAGRHSSLYLEIRYDRTGIRTDDLQWLFFAIPPHTSPAQCLLREILAKPIARMIPPRGSFFGGLWQISAPISNKFQLGISGFGDQVKSFSAECGLLDEGIANSMVWTSVLVTGQDEAVGHLDVDVRGEYELLPDCGTALGSMYRKKSVVEVVSVGAKTVVSQVPAVFLFLDPHKYGFVESDPYVFSLGHHRNPGYASRLTVAELSPVWRAQRVSAAEENVSAYSRSWTAVPSVTLTPVSSQQISYGCREPGRCALVGDHSCRESYITLVSLSAPSPILNLPPVVTPWRALDPARSSPELKDLVWAIQKIATSPASQDWNEIVLTCELPVAGTCCDTCHPPAPSILWGRDRKGRVTPYEDPLGAAGYERALKSKPPAFLAFSQVGSDGRGEVRFALNVQSLAHQAYGTLVKTGTNEGINLKWRLISNAYDLGRHLQSRFTLLSNRGDPVHAQPPNFRQSLRPEQLRSLTWMVSQEADDVEPFTEEETEEAFLPLMSWRAEVKATIPRTIRGGLIADEVGYGKTAIVLGLIDTQFARDQERFAEAPHPEGFIPTKATLIIVPGNVFDQWASEIVKFLGNTYTVLKIPSVAKLGRTALKEIQEVDIVLISWAVLKSEAYYDTMRRFTGTPNAPSRAGRSFDSWFEDAQRCMRELIPVLRDAGPEAYLENVQQRRARLREKQQFSTYVPSRRLRGQAFSIQQQKKLRQPAKTGNDGNGEVEDEAAEAEDGRDSGYDTATEAKDRKKFNIPSGKAALQWGDLRHPLLHAFSFTRIVIDEYTYAGEERNVSLVSLSARSKWILSGTPALDEFADIKSIARHLGVHLGIDDDGDAPTQNSRLKQIRKNLTAVEAFQMFQPVRSDAWYHNRQVHAQAFLNRFARQNTAEIGTINMITHLILSDQLPAERITYQELQKHLVQAKGRTRKLRNPTDDPLISCLNDFMQSCQLAEEALLKCAITSRLTEHPWNIEKCKIQLASKTEMRPKTLGKLEGLIKLHTGIESQWSKNAIVWANFVDTVFATDSNFGDDELANEAFDFVKKTLQSYDDWIGEDSFQKDLKGQLGERLKKARKLAAFSAKQETTEKEELPLEPEQSEEDSKPPKRAKKTKKIRKIVKPADPDHSPEMEKALVEVVVKEVVACVREFIQNERNIRFFQAMIDTQSSKTVSCQGCKAPADENISLTVLRSCGHTLCSDCIMNDSFDQTCVASGCGGSAILSKRISVSTLGTGSRAIESSKLSMMIETINKVPDDELVLLFVQFQDLMLIASHALTSANINHRMARQQSTKAILEFIAPTAEKGKKVKQKLLQPKVLILHLGGAMAAGLNLQCANHVIFLAPLFVPSQHEYEAGMTQAIGRARRFGQTRDVHVYHMLARETVDVRIFQDRSGKVIVERNGQPLLVSMEEIQDGDVMCADRLPVDEERL